MPPVITLLPKLVVQTEGLGRNRFPRDGDSPLLCSRSTPSDKLIQRGRVHYMDGHNRISGQYRAECKRLPLHMVPVRKRRRALMMQYSTNLMH